MLWHHLFCILYPIKDFNITNLIHLFRGLKLKVKSTENFIPIKEGRKMVSTQFFDEGTDAWKAMQQSEPTQVLPKPKSVEYTQNPEPFPCSTLLNENTHKKNSHRCRQNPARKKTFIIKVS